MRTCTFFSPRSSDISKADVAVFCCVERSVSRQFVTRVRSPITRLLYCSLNHTPVQIGLTRILSWMWCAMIIGDCRMIQRVQLWGRFHRWRSGYLGILQRAKSHSQKQTSSLYKYTQIISALKIMLISQWQATYIKRKGRGDFNAELSNPSQPWNYKSRWD